MPATGPSRRAVIAVAALGSGYGMVIPSTVRTGDSMVVAATRFDFPLVLTGHGWTLIATNVYWKVAVATDPGSTVFISSNIVEGALVIYRDAAATQPLVTLGTSATAPAITTTANGSAVARIWMTGSASSSYALTAPATVALEDPVPPTFGTNSFDSFGIGYIAVAVSDAIQAVAGLAPSATATASASVASWVTVSLAFFPAVAPLAPVLGAPTNNSDQFLAGTPTFTWVAKPTTGDGAQNAYAFRRKIVGAGSFEYWNATSLTWGASPVWNTATAGKVTFPAGQWSNANNYDWSVATQEATYNLQGPFATDFVVNGQVPPTVTVTAPTLTVFTSNPTVTWTDTVAPGTVETGFRAIVYNAAQYGAVGFVAGVGPNAWDSGNVQPYLTTITLPPDALPDGTYRVYLQITETNGVASAWAFSGFVVEIENPNPPALSATVTTDPVTALPIIALALQARDNLLTPVDAAFEFPTWKPGPITAIGATASASGTALATLAVHPTAVGDVIVLAGAAGDGGFRGSETVSGGGVATWVLIDGILSTGPISTMMWFGVVTTPGASTIAVTGGSAATATLFAQQFSVGVPSIWSLDTQRSNFQFFGGPGPLAAGPYGTAPITPAFARELCVGAAVLPGGTLGGSSPGFTYASLANGQFIYNVDAENPNTYNPGWTQASSGYASALALLVPSNPAGVGTYAPSNALLIQSQAEADDGSFSMSMQAVAPGAASAKTAAYPI